MYNLENCKKIDLAKIEKCIIQTSTVAWKQHITKTSLERWLNNFKGYALGDKEAERTIAAWLLMNFTYYTESEVQELCRIIFRKYVNTKLKQSKYIVSDEKTEFKIKDIIKHTLFIHLGNPSESGSLILYNFRVANSLPKDIFEMPADWAKMISEKEIYDIVLIDDVTISGSQAIDYIKSLPETGVNTYLLTFFATPNAIKNIQSETNNIIPLFAALLDNRTRIFDSESFVFSNNECSDLKELAYKLCSYYGEKIVNYELPNTESYMKKWPLGFGNGQQMFGFYYNTPDNTIPLFWCESQNWYPAFRRFHKIYNVEGVKISNEQYW